MQVEARLVECKAFVYPSITLPQDENWISLLEAKKEEYYAWMIENYDMRRDLVKWRAKNTQKGYTKTLINRLLKNGFVDTELLSHELSCEYKNLFCEKDFQKACQVAEIYATNLYVLETGLWPGEMS